MREVPIASEMLKGADRETARVTGAGTESAFYPWAMGSSLSLPPALDASSPLRITRLEWSK